MTTPAKYNLYLRANDSFTAVWTIQNQGNVFDISNYTFKLQIRNHRGINSTVYKTLTMGDGITFENASLGQIRITIEPDETITATKEYVYDLAAITEGKPHILLSGVAIVDPGVTYL